MADLEPLPLSVQLEHVRTVVLPKFFEQGYTVVYGTVCCSRLYIGRGPASRCTTCPSPPQNVEIRCPDDVLKLIR